MMATANYKPFPNDLPSGFDQAHFLTYSSACCYNAVSLLYCKYHRNARYSKIHSLDTFLIFFIVLCVLSIALC